jgi:NADH:ubiquinone oxidoreductase subunit 2 (subunit N)
MFMSAGPKAAAFAVFLRVFTTGFSSLGESWEPVV